MNEKEHLEQTILGIQEVIHHAQQAPKSREMSIVITNLETAKLWAESLNK